MGLIIFLTIVSYLLGSISSAVWISKRFYKIDIREYGSKNAGATNMMRILGRKAALPVFIIDFLKGFIAVKLSLFLDYPEASSELFYIKMTFAIAAVVGHIFPIFTGFKGGKGVATITGALFGLTTMAALSILGTFAVILLVTQYVSLGSIVAATMYPIYLVVFFHESTPQIIFGVIVAVGIILTHRKNIVRLIKGEESKTNILRKWTRKK